MSFAILLLLASAIPVDEIPDQELLQIFDQQYYHVELASGEKTYLYRLFRPQNRSPHQTYPLVVWLHGYGDVEFKNIGFGHLKHTGAIFSSREQAQSLGFYFLAVQCPIDQPRFFKSSQVTTPRESSTAEAPEPGEIVVKLIEELIREEAVDPNRVTLVGISGAGAACLEMGMRYPDRYAGMGLLGSPGIETSRVSLLNTTPIWAFHASEDPDISVAGIESTIQAIDDSGGNAALTTIESNYHNCWAIAFRDYALLDWLIAQDRESLWPPRPGAVAWTWKQWSACLILLGLVFLTAMTTLLKHRRARREKSFASDANATEPGIV